MTNPPVRVFTGTSQFGYEPQNEDGQPNSGEVKRILSIIEDEYPGAYERDGLVTSLTDAKTRRATRVPRRQALGRDGGRQCRRRSRRAEANESTVSGLTPEELAHRDKVLALPYKPPPASPPRGSRSDQVPRHGGDVERRVPIQARHLPPEGRAIMRRRGLSLPGE